MERARRKYRLSERHACRLLGQWRGTHRYAPILRSDEDVLTWAIIKLASQYGRYGYRRITALLKQVGWQVGKGRVGRIWRRDSALAGRNFSPGRPVAGGNRNLLSFLVLLMGIRFEVAIFLRGLKSHGLARRPTHR